MSELNVDSTVVIVGAGQAGGEAAAELRRQGFAGRVIMLGEETQPPYKRPPLSKAYLSGAATQESLYVMQPAQLDKVKIEFRGNTKVVRIDRKDKLLELADGSTQKYDKLVIATGGRARPLPLPGADASNVFVLRTIEDVQKIKALCEPGKRVTIIGGGFIGLEGAAVLVKMGLKVTLLEGLPRVLARVTVPEVSAFFERVHREAGVDLRTGAQLAGFEGTPVNAVTLADGTRIETDFVVVGIGLIPNTELADAAGLKIDNGIVVDQYARTGDPDIYAAGDCTNHPSTFLGRNVRLESVQNAMEQGRAVARNILGKNEPYQTVPWFWSDQYDLKLQTVGISGAHDQIVLRGDPATARNFAVFYLKGGKLIAADTVSRPQEFMFAKKLVAEGAVIDPAKLADESVPMKSLATPAA
ncbi:NAD(P)/FAD-dependent oxidoreductase [Sinimarinibacterium flocculans]|uniref:3-phenylpropionate/trans-cinnamate dioxygenase ferredoxin reductase subunit n=1 Tax=Sinimarinibacterium flocculans TaxID=985250 RepID=A0A318E2X3_9GAMM|nr:FAD-dependent oxidoreductase [Sinimarinibacterium flocculans]PXV64295.1 3-phenylpropionate/trans-cinnamate dioxygenase ferredoxin reductase subunit [Sinimarinibacterium flocculans]